jgi:hypothetical protein
MADEISITSKLLASKGGVQVTQLTTTDSVDMAGADLVHQTQSAATSETALDVGGCDITNATGNSYWVKLRNLDSTNFVTVKVKYTAGPLYWPVGLMYPGQMWGPVLMPKLDGSSLGGIYLDADAVACNVEVTVVEA